jgi:8-oxo-dGTP pyrophosphatase MutT (NUDIX family)
MRKEKRVGALPVRRKPNGEREVLLVTTRSNRCWIIPKGCRSKRLSDKRAAAREAEEEGGVTGQIRWRPIGTFMHCRENGESQEVEVFRLDVEQESKHWPEEKERQRAWLSPEKAKMLVKQPALRRIIEQA